MPAAACFAATLGHHLLLMQRSCWWWGPGQMPMACNGCAPRASLPASEWASFLACGWAGRRCAAARDFVRQIAAVARQGKGITIEEHQKYKSIFDSLQDFCAGVLRAIWALDKSLRLRLSLPWFLRKKLGIHISSPDRLSAHGFHELQVGRPVWSRDALGLCKCFRKPFLWARQS